MWECVWALTWSTKHHALLFTDLALSTTAIDIDTYSTHTANAYTIADVTNVVALVASHVSKMELVPVIRDSTAYCAVGG